MTLAERNAAIWQARETGVRSDEIAPRDPIAEFDAVKTNTRAHAAYWLRTGELHPEIHHVIRAEVEQWIARVEAAGAEVLAKLRTLVLVPRRGMN
jgi:hypothetical protein